MPVESGADQRFARRQAVAEIGRCGQADAARRIGQAIEQAEPVGNDVFVRREVVVGQGFPVGEAEHLPAVVGRLEQRQLVRQAVELSRGVGDDQDGTVLVAGQIGQVGTVRAAADGADAAMIPGLDRAVELLAEHGG